jgi:hypothetical protein
MSEEAFLLAVLWLAIIGVGGFGWLFGAFS